MRLLTISIFLALLLFQNPTGEDVWQLNARAIRENRPQLCEKAKESCWSSDWETMCITASMNRFVCYRDYAFAKNDSSICTKIRGESSTGHSYRDECFEHYAREKKDISICEKLNRKGRTNTILYSSCVESVQQLRGNYLLDDCLKIKDMGEPGRFAMCIAGVAKQTNDLALCSRIFSESKLEDGWGHTLLERCLIEAEASHNP